MPLPLPLPAATVASCLSGGDVDDDGPDRAYLLTLMRDRAPDLF